MLTRKYLYLFISLFFLLAFSSKAEAYTMFSYNPYFDHVAINNYPQGIVLFNSLYNNSFYQNATCDGMTNCVIIESNGTAQTNNLYLQQYDWVSTGLTPLWTNSTALSSFNSNNAQNGVNYIELRLPANQEGIIITNYRWNTTLTTPVPIFFVINAETGAYINQTYLNTTTGVWINLSVVINASLAIRNLRMGFYWNWDNLPSKLEIDKFKFYTLDIIEARTTWSATSTDEYSYYCGSDYIALSTSDLCTDTTTTPSPVFKNFNTNNSWLICKDNESSYAVVVKIGNFIKARRVLTRDMPRSYASCKNANDVSYLLWQMRDSFFGYFSSFGCDVCWGFNNYYYLEGLSLSTAKITLLSNNSSTIYSRPFMLYSGTPTAQINMQNSTNTALLDYLYTLFPNNMRITQSLLPFSNTSTPSGSTFKMCQYTGCTSGSDSMHSNNPSAWYSFFSASTNLCTPQWSCSQATNNETYTNSNCDITQNNYCGDCGCGTTRCNANVNQGSYCDENDPLKTTIMTSVGCTNTSIPCPSGSTCEQLTPQYNATHGLTENIADCSHCWFGWKWNFAYGNYTIDKTNCAGYTSACAGTTHSAFGVPFFYIITWGNGVYYYNQTITGSVTISSYTAACIKADGSTALIINETGGNTTEKELIEKHLNVTLNNTACPNTAIQCYDSNCNAIPCPSPEVLTNPFGYGALLFGSLFGMGDVANLQTDVAMFAIFLSLILSIATAIGISYKKSEFAEKAFGYSFLGWFSLFTIGLNNLLLWAVFAVMVIISAGIMSGYFKKVIGGG